MVKQITREQKVGVFQDALDRPRGVIDLAEMTTAVNLIKEECKEVSDAVDALILTDMRGTGNLQAKAHLMKELCDLQYVLSGMVVLMGFDRNFDAAFNRVHESNMLKIELPRQYKDGKLLKGPNYKAPRLEDLV